MLIQFVKKLDIMIEQHSCRQENKRRIKEIVSNKEIYVEKYKRGILTNAIIQIHTGSRPIPNYVKTCIEQIRLQDSEIPIYFVCSKGKDISCIPSYCNILFEEDLLISHEHLEFLMKVSKQNITSFFQVTIERFFILYDAMITLGLENILHLENDNMLYTEATELMLKLSEIYDKIAIPRASRWMCCASIMYVPSQNAMVDFLQYINDSEGIYFNDMALLPAYVDVGRGATLPTITKEYVKVNGLITVNGVKAKTTERKTDYYNNFEKLEGIFDCACIGQYIDGCDRKYHPDQTAGFVNQETYLDSRKLRIQWEKDEDKLIRPYIYDAGEKYSIFNLHIHSKQLECFMSNHNCLIQ